MASTTKTFLKSRAAESAAVKPGQWHAGFSKVKKYAEAQKIPLIAVWSNGDACGHCTAFENSCMQSAFTKWMKASGCAFWFGCSSDKMADDKYEGTGFNWTRNKKLTTYPFCRVYWKAGSVDTYKSGDDWTGGTSKGGATFVKKLQALLKKFDPNPAPAPAPVPETKPTDECEGGDCNVDPGCDGGNCNAGGCCITEAEAAALKAELESVKADLAKISGRVAEAERALSACQAK